MRNNDPEKQRELEIHAMQSIMSTEGGRDFAWRILEQCGIMADDFDPDSRVHAQNSGRRSVGLWLQGELMEASLDHYLKMLKEHIDG